MASLEVVSKVRALQVVLATVPMDKQMKNTLMRNLQHAHQKGGVVPVEDAALIASLVSIEYDLAEIDKNFSKDAMLSRINTARKRLRYMIGKVEE